MHTMEATIAATLSVVLPLSAWDTSIPTSIVGWSNIQEIYKHVHIYSVGYVKYINTKGIHR